MKRSSKVTVLVAAFSVIAWAGRDCAARGPGGDGGGDELDQRIEDASLKVRADRPWHSSGTMGPEDPVSYASYQPCCRQGGWSFSVTPYFWAPGQHGHMRVKNQRIDIDSSIGDTLSSVFDNFQFAGSVQLEADYCKWSVILDVLYVHLANDETINPPGVAPIHVDWDTKEVMAQAMVGYQFAWLPLGCPGRCFRPCMTFDVLAGARFYWFDASIDLGGGGSVSGDHGWVDPVVGLRMLFHVTPTLTFNVTGDVGGFGAGSDLSWRIIAGADWRFCRNVSLIAGWSVLSIDYKSTNFDYDVVESGPYLGVTLRF